MITFRITCLLLLLAAIGCDGIAAQKPALPKPAQTNHANHVYRMSELYASKVPDGTVVSDQGWGPGFHEASRVFPMYLIDLDESRAAWVARKEKGGPGPLICLPTPSVFEDAQYSYAPNSAIVIRGSFRRAGDGHIVVRHCQVIGEVRQ